VLSSRRACASLAAKPIRWVVPYTPAGITDNVTRMVTQKLQESLGQSIVVENKPGANSIVGADLIAKGAPRRLQHPDRDRRARGERDAVRGQAAVRSGEELHADLARRDRAADPDRRTTTFRRRTPRS
jgi:hypothetical protein